MKNILFIHSSSELYGSDKSLFNIISNLDRTKYNVFVILPSKGELFYKIQSIDNVKIYEYIDLAVLRRKNLSVRGIFSFFRNFRLSINEICSFIKENNIEIVYTNTAVVISGAVAAKICRVRSVWHVREIINNKIEKIIISILFNIFADIIIANSKATAKGMIIINKKKIKIVYNAVNQKELGPKFQHNQIIVGMAGRINRWKGQKFFVDAAKIVLEKEPDINIVFWIAGDSYNGENYLKIDLKKYIEENNLSNNIHLLGQVYDMDRFYRNLDIFVLPSIKPEPFGLVIIEAMEYGLPVVATNHGGPMEIINNGIDGFLVDYNYPYEMAERIIELSLNESERKEIGMKARRKKQEKFSVKAMVSNIEKIFDEE